jgi:uncharacterized protein YhbP (UPF0306 family)
MFSWPQETSQQASNILWVIKSHYFVALAAILGLLVWDGVVFYFVNVKEKKLYLYAENSFMVAMPKKLALILRKHA